TPVCYQRYRWRKRAGHRWRTPRRRRDNSPQPKRPAVPLLPVKKATALGAQQLFLPVQEELTSSSPLFLHIQRASTSKRHERHENPAAGCPNCVRENGFTTGCRSEQNRFAMSLRDSPWLPFGAVQRRLGRGADVAFICPVAATNAAAETSEKPV